MAQFIIVQGGDKKTLKSKSLKPKKIIVQQINLSKDLKSKSFQ